jgi:hypothetical protein
MHVNSVSLYEAAESLEKLSNIVSNSDNLTNNFYNSQTILPVPCSETWNSVKYYLTYIRKIPENIINQLHNDSLLWSDKNKNCVFPRDLGTGAYLRGTLSGFSFKRTLGINGRPYVIPGENMKIITEAPIDAISLRYYYPKATIIATGGRIGFDKILPYLENNDIILLAHDNDKAGDSQAAAMKKNFNHAERLRPFYNFKDWNEVLQFEITNNIKVFHNTF